MVEAGWESLNGNVGATANGGGRRRTTRTAA
jgi:hypothetical protein